MSQATRHDSKRPALWHSSFVLTHFMEGIGLALDVERGRMFVSDVST